MVRIMWYALQDHTDTLNRVTTDFLASFLESYQNCNRLRKTFGL